MSPNYGRSWYKGRQSALLVTIFAGIALTLVQLSQNYKQSPGKVHAIQLSNPKLKFLRYEKSTWEDEWFRNRKEYASHPQLLCETLTKDINRIQKWLSGINQGVDFATVSSDIFSSLIMEDPQTGLEVIKPIEPLVGNFRHPYGIPHCKPVDSPEVPIESRDYILFTGHSKSDIEKYYPGKKYLFDLGTAQFPTSLGYLTKAYAKHGITFDEIWAWELQPQLPPENYWKDVNTEVLGSLHFYNIGVDANKDSNANPFNIIRRVYRPGDLIVLKLDIDNDVLELNMLDQLVSDPFLRSAVTEVFFEMHYDSVHMEMYFGHPKTKYLDVIDLFTDLRSSGMHIHYWP